MRESSDKAADRRPVCVCRAGKKSNDSTGPSQGKCKKKHASFQQLLQSVCGPCDVGPDSGWETASKHSLADRQLESPSHSHLGSPVSVRHTPKITPEWLHSLC